MSPAGWTRMGELSRTPASLLVRVAFVFYPAVALLALGWMITRADLGLLGPAKDPLFAQWGLPTGALADLGLGMAMGWLVALGSQTLFRGRRWGEPFEKWLLEHLRGLRPRDAVALAVLSGVGEELLFRGALQPLLLTWWSPLPAVAAASVLFALCHFAPDRRLLPWTATTFVLGLVLGGLALGTGSLIAPIALHATVNGLNLTVAAWELRAGLH